MHRMKRGFQLVCALSAGMMTIAGVAQAPPATIAYPSGSKRGAAGDGCKDCIDFV